jgi:cytochrome c-type protein NapB
MSAAGRSRARVASKRAAEGDSMTMKAAFLAILLALAFPAFAADGFTDPMRGKVPILDEPVPPPLQPQDNKDVRRVRSHPMQPPTIPHKIEGYQLDRNVNRCLFCHTRTRIEETRAIPLSVTHYMDRDGNVRGDVSPRRYFCTQCHVPQDEVKPLVENRFEDFETVARRPAGKAATKSK